MPTLPPSLINTPKLLSSSESESPEPPEALIVDTSISSSS